MSSPLRTSASSASSVLSLLLLLAACASKPPVHTERDPLADFARYRTYAWLAAPREPTPRDPDPTRGGFAWHTRMAVDSQLGKRGYLETDPNVADLLVSVGVTIDEKHADTLGDFMRYRDSGGTEGLFSAFSLGYEETRLTVELFDAGTRQVVWRGIGAISMDAHDRGPRVEVTVAQMFEAYPKR